MARSRGGSSARPAPRPASPRTTSSAPPPPAPSYSAPPPAPMQSGGGGGLMANMVAGVAQGMAVGTGSALAHRAVDSVLGPRTIVHEQAPAAAPAAAAPAGAQGEVCFNQRKAFMDCLENSSGDISRCQFYHDALEQCKKQGF